MQAGLYLTATRGYTAPEALVCYERAESLCVSLNQPLVLFSALRGLWRYSLQTDKLSATMKIAARVYSLAQDQHDSALMMGGPPRFCRHIVLFGLFRDRAAIRDAWRSALALE